MNKPEQVQALVAADMAPVAYGHRFDGVIAALDSPDLAVLGGRKDADARLAEHLDNPGLRGYLLQNLVKEGDAWRWRIDLPVLNAHMDELLGFPDAAGRQFPGPALFAYGTESDYVTGNQLSAIRELFPLARLRAIPNAGHWVYSDQPDSFLRVLQGFLSA